MSKKIEILENTLLKLLVRRGTDAERQLITLDVGELGYTTDGKRLFVGDGSTVGGKVAGNVFLGSAVDHTLITEGTDGDFAFNTTNNTLYAKNGTSWDRIAVLFTAADGSIEVDVNAGTIAVGTLSASHFEDATDLTGNSIEIVSGQISLSSTQIKTNRVTPSSTSHLFLPQNLNINNVEYQFPTGGLGGANSFLKTDTEGNLRWAAPESNANLFFNSSAAAIPVGGMVESATLSSMPTGWLLADGQTVAGADYPDLSAAIGDIYGANAGHTTFDLPDESANGPVFIKALPDTVVTPDFTVKGGLSATVDGTQVAEGDTFSPLDTNVVISTFVPGVEVYDSSGSGTFVTRSPYTKFWITGSGAKGRTRTGGAAATVTGILSAPIGTSVDYFVGGGITTDNTDGNPSYISVGGTELARSVGAEFQTSGLVPDGTTNTGNLSTNGTGLAGGESAYILGGHVIEGGRGGWDTNEGGEDVGGTASFWGSDGVAGAGAGGHNGDSVDTAAGLIKFEWGM